MTTVAANRHIGVGASLVEGEFPFTISNFTEISGIVRSASGIDLQESKATLVYSRLVKRLRERNLRGFSDYCDLVRSDEDERHRMIAALTTNVTRFFREVHHFEHLRTKIIEPMASQARRGNKIRIWSSACSTGQEPYSIALTILSVIPEAAELDVRILATDLNPFVIETGKKGEYDEAEIADIGSQFRSRWLQPATNGRRSVAGEARRLVSFRVLNLMDVWPMQNKFDAIFCRNVAIYFDRPTQENLWQRFAGVIRQDGALYIGHSERVAGSAAGAFLLDGVTSYIKKGGAN